MVSVPGNMMDSGLTTSASAGVAPTPSVLAGGSIPGFAGPPFLDNPEGSLSTRLDDTSSPPFKIFLRIQKRTSFRAFWKSLDLSQRHQQDLAHD